MATKTDWTQQLFLSLLHSRVQRSETASFITDVVVNIDQQSSSQSINKQQK